MVFNVFLFFFTKKKQTLHDLIFKSVFVNNPPIKKYIISGVTTMVFVILIIVLMPFFKETKTSLTFSVNNKNKTSQYALDNISNRLSVLFNLNQYHFDENKNQIEIFLPENISKDSVIFALASKKHLVFQELINNNWQNSELNESYIATTSPWFEDDGTMSVFIEFTAEGKKIFANLTKRNIGKNIQVVFDNKVISSGVVSEELIDSDYIIEVNSISEMKDLITQITFADGEYIKLISENNNRKVTKRAFHWK